MVKRIRCDDPGLKAQVQALLKFHLGAIGELAERLELSIAHTDEQGDRPLYVCRVVVTDLSTGRLAVEERQADISLSVNRALTRIVRSLLRRRKNRRNLVRK
jgi:hypothetical protein